MHSAVSGVLGAPRALGGDVRETLGLFTVAVRVRDGAVMPMRIWVECGGLICEHVMRRCSEEVV